MSVIKDELVGSTTRANGFQVPTWAWCLKNVPHERLRIRVLVWDEVKQRHDLHREFGPLENKAAKAYAKECIDGLGMYMAEVMRTAQKWNRPGYEWGIVAEDRYERDPTP